MNERKCGRLGKLVISECADRAAAFITEYVTPRAVCLAPDGNVTVESPEHVILCDLVGVYRPLGRIDLWRMISDDLAVAVRERKIAGGTGHKHRVKHGVKRAA